MTALLHTTPAGRVPASLRIGIATVAILLVSRLLLVSGDDEPITWNDVVASLAFTAVGLAVALGAVLPRVERAPSTAASAALALAVLSLLSLPMFWFSGAPFALSASAVALALVSGARGGRRTAAIAVGGFVLVASLGIALMVTIAQFDPTLPA